MRTSPTRIDCWCWLLRFLLFADDQIDWAVAHLDPAWIQHPLVRQIVQQRLATGHDWRGVPALLDMLDNPAAQSLVTEAVAEDVAQETLAAKLSDTTLRLHLNALASGTTPLLTPEPFQPTDAGRRVLAGEADARLLSPTDRWLGGVHLRA